MAGVLTEVTSNMGWKNLLASLLESVDDPFRLRDDNLVVEHCILHNQMNGRVELTDSEYKERVEIGAKWGHQALDKIATVAQPDTLLAWTCKFTNQKVELLSRLNLLVIPVLMKQSKTE